MSNGPEFHIQINPIDWRKIKEDLKKWADDVAYMFSQPFGPKDQRLIRNLRDYGGGSD